MRHLAEKNLETEIKSIRKIFKPSIEVQETMVEDTSQSRKSLLKAVKNKVAYSDASRCKSEKSGSSRPGSSFYHHHYTWNRSNLNMGRCHQVSPE